MVASIARRLPIKWRGAPIGYSHKQVTPEQNILFMNEIKWNEICCSPKGWAHIIFFKFTAKFLPRNSKAMAKDFKNSLIQLPTHTFDESFIYYVSVHLSQYSYL